MAQSKLMIVKNKKAVVAATSIMLIRASGSSYYHTPRGCIGLDDDVSFGVVFNVMHKLALENTLDLFELVTINPETNSDRVVDYMHINPPSEVVASGGMAAAFTSFNKSVGRV